MISLYLKILISLFPNISPVYNLLAAFHGFTHAENPPQTIDSIYWAKMKTNVQHIFALL